MRQLILEINSINIFTSLTFVLFIKSLDGHGPDSCDIVTTYEIPSLGDRNCAHANNNGVTLFGSQQEQCFCRSKAQYFHQ